MAAGPISSYGLRGRVVTMDASRTILDDGIAWVADGSISDVTAATDRLADDDVMIVPADADLSALRSRATALPSTGTGAV